MTIVKHGPASNAASKQKEAGAVVLALDAMGGDFAPEEVVLGAAAAAGPSLAVLLVGRKTEIEKALAGAKGAGRDFVEIIDAPDIIGFDEEPVKAVRQKANSSLVAACRLVAEGRAAAAVSAGNTGAMLAAALLQLGRIRGLKRPGLCTVLPTPGKPTVFIDVGASSEARPLHLLEFANMASIFAADVLGIANPSVGLVSIGEESVKGNELVLEAHRLMASQPQLNFYGNIEGRDIIRNVVDVVVTDGFTGNVCLKLMESTSSLIIEEVKKAAAASLTAKIGGALLKRRLGDFRKSIDAKEIGGAYLLGVRGLVIVCHGNSDRRAIASALGYAARAAQQDLVGNLGERVASL